MEQEFIALITLRDGTTTTDESVPVEWSTSDAEVARLLGPGRILTTGPGSVTITASRGSASTAATLDVVMGTVSMDTTFDFTGNRDQPADTVTIRSGSIEIRGYFELPSCNPQLRADAIVQDSELRVTVYSVFGGTLPCPATSHAVQYTVSLLGLPAATYQLSLVHLGDAVRTDGQVWEKQVVYGGS
ncbi:MAG: hypothetical protein ACRELD_14530 [Longimicrobiales bacterium]